MIERGYPRPRTNEVDLILGLSWLMLLALALGLGAYGCDSGAPRDGGPEGGPDGQAARRDGDLAGAAKRAPHAKGWVYVEGGTFKMGSPPLEPGRLDIETQHFVTLTTDFLIQPTEVTQEQFESVMGYNPSHFTKCGPTCPVEDLTWHEAATYCNRLSDSEGLRECYSCTGSGREVRCQRNGIFASLYECPGYRLPSEAEWEHAARTGDERSTYRGNLQPGQLECESPNPVLDPIAWFCGNSEGRTHPVGQKEPNPRGLYDMLGNVWEWNHDWDRNHPRQAVTDPWGPVNGLSRVGHGGSWVNKGRLVRFAARGGGTPDKGYGFLGFRVARSCLGEATRPLCRHEYVFRWADSKRADRPRGEAEADAGGGREAADGGSPDEAHRSAVVRSNTLIIILIVAGVLGLFAAERTIRVIRRRRARRRDPSD